MTTIDAARDRLSAARSAVIRAEEALSNAIRRRDEAEEALYRVEENDLGGGA